MDAMLHRIMLRWRDNLRDSNNDVQYQSVMNAVIEESGSSDCFSVTAAAAETARQLEQQRMLHKQCVSDNGGCDNYFTALDAALVACIQNAAADLRKIVVPLRDALLQASQQAEDAWTFIDGTDSTAAFGLWAGCGSSFSGFCRTMSGSCNCPSCAT